MKLLSLVSIMGALALGTAGAAGTIAGTAITNTATASWTDPTTGTTITQSSNTVSTTVQAVPSFTVTPNTGAGTLSRTAKPGDTVAFMYTVTNTGNVGSPTVAGDGDSYSITTGSIAGAPAGARFYLTNPDTNNDGYLSASELTAAGAGVTGNITISDVDADAARNFYVVYQVPLAATDNQVMGTNPSATRLDNASTTLDNGIVLAADIDNANTTTVQRQDAGVVGPQGDANADGLADVGGTALTTYTSVEGRTITYAGDSQTISNLPISASARVVTYVNTVVNTGNRDDIFNLTATLGANFPAGTTVQILNMAGTPITATTSLSADTDGAGPARGGDFTFQVRVTVPAGGRADLPATVTVRATSNNDTTKFDETRDVIQKIDAYAAAFGNDSAGTPDPTLNPVKSGNTGSTVYIPMDLANTGNMNDTFNVGGTVTFPTNDPANPTATATIVYYLDANGDGLPDSGTPITNPLAVPAGTTVRLVGAVVIPAGAVAGAATGDVEQAVTSTTTGVTYRDSNDTIGVGNTGTINIVKTADRTVVNPGENITYTISAKSTYNGAISFLRLSDRVPLNTTFVSVTGVALNSTGTQLNSPSKIMYRVGDSGTWADSPAAAGMTAGLGANTDIQMGLDRNGDNTVDSNDMLPAGGELRMTFTVKVN